MDPALTSPWINPVTIAGLLSAGWLGYMGQPQIVQMFMGMKDPGSSRRGAVIAGTTGVFLLFGSFFVNLCCMVLFPDSADTSANFILLITEYTPSWLVGIVTAAILAADPGIAEPDHQALALELRRTFPEQAPAR